MASATRTLRSEIMQDKIRTTVITGFLGAGKTTLLNHLVSQPTEK
ncbi:MAG TPA: hypothetical protein DCE40_00400, partial [Exiguobacterium sp.]|nr:hypothetical protein [Exiguobacterium sp.]